MLYVCIMYVCMYVSAYVVRWFGRDHGTSGPARTSMVPRQHRPVDACQIRKVTACADLVHRRGLDQSMAGMFVLIICRSSATGDLFLSTHGQEGVDEKGLIATPQQGLDPFCWFQHGSQGASIYAAYAVPMGRISSLGAAQLSEPGSQGYFKLTWRQDAAPLASNPSYRSCWSASPHCPGTWLHGCGTTSAKGRRAVLLRDQTDWK